MLIDVVMDIIVFHSLGIEHIGMSAWIQWVWARTS